MIIIQPNIVIPKEQQKFIYMNLLEQKEKGIILVPNGFKVIVCGEEDDIKFVNPTDDQYQLNEPDEEAKKHEEYLSKPINMSTILDIIEDLKAEAKLIGGEFADGINYALVSINKHIREKE